MSVAVNTVRSPRGAMVTWRVWGRLMISFRQAFDELSSW